jgi:hypothetical protein
VGLLFSPSLTGPKRTFCKLKDAILFAGGARPPLDDFRTFNGARAAEAATIPDVRWVVPATTTAGAHFSEGRDDVITAFTDAGIADRLELN